MTVIDQPRKVIEQPQQLWSTMPGWGIVANLLPPEVILARRIRVLRKLMTMVLIAVVVLGCLGYGYAFWQAHRASATLSAEQNRGSQLTAQQDKYANVVRIEGNVANVKSQIATLLADDVDFSTLIVRVGGKLPHGATISQMSVTLAVGSQPAAASGTDSSVLDTSGHPHIGAITLTGQAGNLDQVAAFVSSLATVPGIVGVFPTSQQGGATSQRGGGAAVQFNVALTLTDQVLSHRYTTTGGN
jgi:hypothetical protein